SAASPPQDPAATTTPGAASRTAQVTAAVAAAMPVPVVTTSASSPARFPRLAATPAVKGVASSRAPASRACRGAASSGIATRTRRGPAGGTGRAAGEAIGSGMPEEAAPLHARLAGARELATPFTAGVAARRGNLAGLDALVVTTGIGIAAATAAVTWAVLEAAPGVVVAAGSCGGLAADVEV